MSEKPHKGKIKNWWKQKFDRFDTEAYYGESAGLGFNIRGTFVDHPVFGYSPHSHTSWVIAMGEPDADGNIEIETRNSRYTLVGAPAAAPTQKSGDPDAKVSQADLDLLLSCIL